MRCARIDNAVAADPDIISDGYGFAELNAGGADFRVKRVPGRINADPRAEHNIVSDGYRADIQNDAIVIGIKIVSRTDGKTVITMKRRMYAGIAPDMSEQTSNDFPPARFFIFIGRIKLVA